VKEMKTAVSLLKDADERLRAELKHAKTGVDHPNVRDGMARETMVIKIKVIS